MTRRKNPAAVELGRRGGVARARRLSARRRREIAVLAVSTRWKRHRRAAKPS